MAANSLQHMLESPHSLVPKTPVCRTRCGLGFRVQGSGFRVEGLGFRVGLPPYSFKVLFLIPWVKTSPIDIQNLWWLLFWIIQCLLPGSTTLTLQACKHMSPRLRYWKAKTRLLFIIRYPREYGNPRYSHRATEGNVARAHA